MHVLISLLPSWAARFLAFQTKYHLFIARYIFKMNILHNLRYCLLSNYPTQTFIIISQLNDTFLSKCLSSSRWSRWPFSWRRALFVLTLTLLPSLSSSSADIWSIFSACCHPTLSGFASDLPSALALSSSAYSILKLTFLCCLLGSPLHSTEAICMRRGN